MRWPGKETRGRPLRLDFDKLTTTSDPFRVAAGRYGLLIDCKLSPGGVTCLATEGLVSDAPVVISNQFSKSGYQVLDLIDGSYLILVPPSSVVYARLLPIKV
jgi:hypothetical protein